MKAIVTGHARGLGEAIAEQLLTRNIPVLGLARHRHAALAERFPTLLEQIEIDLADGAALARWLAGEALRRFVADAGDGGLLLVNNAGTVQPVAPLGAQESARIAQAISLNVTAPLVLADAVTAVRPAGGLRILHVSSGAAHTAYAGWSIYCATKAALDQHARAAALDALPGVRICSLAPGVIDTGMQAEIRASSLENFPGRARFDGLKRDGQLTSPTQAGQRLVAFLLSEGFASEPVADLRQL